MKTSPQNRYEYEDGISPRELEKRIQADKRKLNRVKPNHHAQQLCKQVFQAIDCAITCDCGDPLLDDLQTVAVCPIGKSSTLEVTFTTPETNLDRVADMQEALRKVTGILRSAVAGAITRKRVPQLAFKIVVQKPRD